MNMGTWINILPSKATTTTITMMAIMAPFDSANVLSDDPPAPASLSTVPPEFAVPAPSPQSVVHLSVAKGNEEVEVADMMNVFCLSKEWNRTVWELLRKRNVGRNGAT